MNCPPVYEVVVVVDPSVVFEVVADKAVETLVVDVCVLPLAYILEVVFAVVVEVLVVVHGYVYIVVAVEVVEVVVGMHTHLHFANVVEFPAGLAVLVDFDTLAVGFCCRVVVEVFEFVVFETFELFDNVC